MGGGCGRVEEGWSWCFMRGEGVKAAGQQASVTSYWPGSLVAW